MQQTWIRFRSPRGDTGFGLVDGDRVIVYDGPGYTGSKPTGAVLPRDEVHLLAPCEPCLLYTSPSPRDQRGSRMPSSA